MYKNGTKAHQTWENLEMGQRSAKRCFCVAGLSTAVTTFQQLWPSFSSCAPQDPLFVFRDVLWTQSTSRGRQHSMSQQRGAEWRCAGHCCREQDAGCSTRKTTVASHHWISANRGKHSGESAVFINTSEKKYWPTGNCTITPHCACKIHNMAAFLDFTVFSWDCIADGCTVYFSLDISNSPNYWVGTLMNQYITSPQSLVVNMMIMVMILVEM